MKYRYWILIFGIALFLCFQMKEEPNVKKQPEEKRGIFFSYIEVKRYLYLKDVNESKENIQNVIHTMKKYHFNMLILQVRPFADAIYPSKIFPSSTTVVQNQGDVLPYDFLSYFIKIAHQNNIEVHAWINPYRVQSSTDLSKISMANPVYSFLGTSHVEIIPDKGIYLNPASLEVQNLIAQGVEELVQNYDIDGIHFDDYFYPSKTIDLVSYEESGTDESLYNYRINQVNQLIQRVYKIVHQKKNCVFGISPQGNIENNYESQYADVRTWAAKKGYVDYLMPQVYYGFYNETKPYYDVVQEWNNLVKKKEVQLYFTLALYKTGLVDSYAKSGANEWIEESNILEKEIIIARNLKRYKGFSLYRYDYLVNPEIQVENTLKEIKNLQEILN